MEPIPDLALPKKRKIFEIKVQFIFLASSNLLFMIKVVSRDCIRIDISWDDTFLG